MRLRQAVLDDGPEVAALVHRAVETFGVWADPAVWRPLDVRDHVEVWRRRYVEPGNWSVVAEDDGRLVGTVSLQPAREAYGAGPEIAGLGHVATVMVDPGWWGRGVGRALLAAAVDEARARGYRRLQLWTATDNDRARRFYEREGWRRTDDRHTGTDGLPIVRYELTVR